MSRILRRPMFRGGGKVDSYGTGITAPLVPGYMGGGQIGGGIVYGKPMADGRFGFEKPIIPNLVMPNNILTNVEKSLGTGTGITTGSELLRAANQKLRGDNAYTLPPGVAMKETETTTETEEAQPVGDIDIGDADNLFGEKDTTTTVKVPDGKGGFEEKVVFAESEGPSPLVELNLGIIDREEYNRKIREQKYDDNKGKGRVFEGDEEMIGDPRPDTEALPIEDPKLPGEKELEEGTQISAKDAIAENQKLFAELLGADKARGQDIGDMLLRFSGSGGNTLGEKFQNYVRAESAAGPSRSEKIKQTAAGLAINDYVAGKRSKEQIEALKTKIDYTQGVKDASVQLSANDDLSLAKAKASKLTDKGINSDETTKALIQTKLGTGVPVFRAQIKLKDIVKKADKLKPGYNLVDNEGVTTIVFYDGTNQPQVKGTIDEFWSS